MHLTEKEISTQIEQDKSRFAERSEVLREFLRREAQMVRSSREQREFREGRAAVRV